MTPIPDIIDEQRAAELLSNARDIIEPHQQDEAAQVHINAYEMAAQTADLLNQSFQKLCERSQANSAVAARVTRARDFQQQLAAHHLDMLDRMATA